VINVAAGGYFMSWVARKADATTDFMAEQLGAFARMPSWAYGQLTQEELGACAGGSPLSRR
jgi:hypothetical protein